MIKTDKESTIEKYDRSNLIYNQDFTFYQIIDITKSRNLSFESKFSRLNEFSNCLKKLFNHKVKKKIQKKEKYCVRCNFWILQRFARNLFR